MAKTSTRVIDALTGRFVPKEEANTRPGSTVTLTIKVGKTKQRNK